MIPPSKIKAMTEDDLANYLMCNLRIDLYHADAMTDARIVVEVVDRLRRFANEKQRRV
jgi:hypothetical protein